MGLIYMKSITTYYNIFIFQFCLLGFLYAGSQNHVSVNILNQDINSVLVEYIIADYEISEVNIIGEVQPKDTLDTVRIIKFYNWDKAIEWKEPIIK